MARLQWIRIEKFRNTPPGTELLFNEGHNVLLGKNGSGKTTLLELLAAFIGSDFRPFSREEIKVVFGVKLAAASAEVSVAIEKREAPFGAPPMTGEVYIPVVSAVIRAGDATDTIELNDGTWNAKTHEGSTKAIPHGCLTEVVDTRKALY